MKLGYIRMRYRTAATLFRIARDGMTEHRRLSLCIVVLLNTIVMTHAGEYPYGLSLTKNATLRWKTDAERKTVSFSVTVLKEKRMEELSMIGFGFSNHGEIENADFAVFVRYRPHGWKLRDSWTNNFGVLNLDESRDFHLDSVEEDDSVIRVIFTRKYVTCDPHDYVIDNGTTNMLFFTSYNQDNLLKFYTRRLRLKQLSPVVQRAQLIKSRVSPTQLSSGAKTVDITAPLIEVPHTATTYWCYLTKLPEITEKHHIIKFEPIITPGNEHLVHHMELFHCEVGPDIVIKPYNMLCNSERKPAQLKNCEKVIGAWAMGATGLELPTVAGLPIGGNHFSRYVVLEVHYNNPTLEAGAKDASGIRFYYTPKLRRYDAATMELGLIYTPKMAIPPEQKMFTLEGHCVPGCTHQALPRRGIHIFASQLHTHLTGRKVYTKHIRNGKELPELNRDDHYSPHFQEIRLLPQPVHVLPGDALKTACTYRTINRKKVTLGGLAITDEMCVNYVYYYPKADLEVCKSAVDTSSLERFFSVMGRITGLPASLGRTPAYNYGSTQWDYPAVAALKRFYELSPLDVKCDKSSGIPYMLSQREKMPITIEFPLTKNKPC